jgi:hypothetical protein
MPAVSHVKLKGLTMICAWCRYMISSKRPVTDQHGRTYCTEDHRLQYLLAHPVLCDCGCRHLAHVTLSAHRFASRSCLIGYETVT